MNKALCSLALLLTLFFCTVPVACAENVLDYPAEMNFAALTIPDPITTLDELAEAVDTSLYLSVEQGEEMVYYHLSDSLRDEALVDPAAFVGQVLQISLLGHTFHNTYDDSRLGEGYLGLRAAITPDYASHSTGQEEASPVMSYALYKNALQAEKRALHFSELPLCKKAEPYLPVENSEQLVFAAQYGYLPYGLPGSPAEALLCRALEILAQITSEEMSETACYEAIYQYVLQSNQYDYTTLLEPSEQNRQNRVFFLEGAMLDGRSVCDGLSKELVLLSRLMGLEAWHIGARSSEGGHAYVYVKADGVWYLSCPTYGSALYSRKDGQRQDYHTNNYMLTDFDTNTDGWPFDSDAHEDIEQSLRQTSAYDYWSETTVQIGDKRYSFHPETVEDALAVLRDACEVQRALNIPVEVELCGKVDVLREAYLLGKEEAEMVYLSGGTFCGQRLQVYLIGAQK